jgi:hypothetical protein
MASIGDVPDLVKLMHSLFGEKWGKRLGRLFVVLIIIGAMGAAIGGTKLGVDALGTWIDSLNKTPVIMNLIIAILSMVLIAVSFMTVSGVLGVFFGFVIAVGFFPNMNRAVRKIFIEYQRIIDDSIKNNPLINHMELLGLKSQITQLQDDWDKKSIAKFNNWLDRHVYKTSKKQPQDNKRGGK